MTEPALIANRAHCRHRRWGFDLVRVAGLVLLGFCAWLPLRADTVLTTTNATVLQLALNAGGVIRFNFSDTFRLATNLVITNNVTLDGSGQNITFDGGGFIGVFTNVTVHTNADFTIRVTNLTVFSSTNGSRLFVVNSNAQLSLLNVSLLNGHATNGGAILNRGTLVVSNCLFGGNAAAGRTGANGSNGSTNLFGNGGDGGNGGAGGGGLGGAICNYGTAHVFRSQFYTNAAIGGDGGKGGRGGDGNLNAGQGGDGGNGGSALGGAIYNSRTLALLNCEVDVNYAAGGYGGDRGVHGSGLFTLYDGVGGAGGVAHGAGIYNSGLLNPTACTLARNGARGGDSAKGGTDSGTSNGSTGAVGGASFGGGICNLGTNTMINCTVFTNYAMGGLGGSGGDGDINAGQGGAGGAASGGSVYNSGRTVVTNCTIVGGTSYGGFGGLPGAGLFAATSGANGLSRGANLTHNSGAFILKNTILAYPVSQTNSYATTNLTYTTNITGITTNWSTYIDPISGLTITNGISGYTTNVGVVTSTNVIGNTNIAVGFNGYGTFTDAGFNLTSDGTPSFSGTSLKNIDPRLELPNPNGGPTLTMALAPNSPAVNRGDTNTGAYLATDQRGFPRVVGGRADIGAFESAVVGLFSVSGVVSDLDSSVPDAGLTNVLLTLTATFTNGSGQSQSSTFTTLTKTNGTYLFTNIPNGSIEIVPTRSRYFFTPSSHAGDLTNDLTLDFAGYRVFSISGTVTLAGAGLADVTVSAGTEGTDATTDAAGFYTISDLSVGDFPSYEVVPLLDGYTFSPPSTTVTSGSNVTNINFTAVGARVVSGAVTNAAGQGVSNVVVVVGGDFDTTDTNGFYSVSNLLPGIYEVIPFASGVAFTPNVTDADVTDANVTANFLAVGLSNIGGRVTNGVTGAGVSNVLITTDSGTARTGSNGFYTLPSVAANSPVTPSLAGFVFNPTNRLVAGASTNYNFSAAPLLTISGTITEGTNILTSATVTLTATGTDIYGRAVTTSNTTSSGTYTLANLLPGTYTVTPAGSNFVFTPGSRSVTLTTSNQPAVNFAASRFLALAISGAVLEGTNGVSNLLVTATGTNINGVAVTNFTITGTNGLYSLTNLLAGAYTVAPANVGVGFRPSSTNVTLATTNLASVNFTARPASLQLVSTSNQSRQFQLTITALPSRIYKIQSATNLPAGTNWRPYLTVFTGTNGVLQTLVTNSNASLFLRSTTP